MLTGSTHNMRDIRHGGYPVSWPNQWEISIRIFLWLVVVCILSGHTESFAINQQTMLKEPEKIPQWISQNLIQFEQVPNPHWDDKKCIACHKAKPAGSMLHLRGRSIDELCEYCHSGVFDHSYIHPNGVAVSSDMLKRAPKEFKKKLDKGNKLSCTTCHEVEMQCLKEQRSLKRINPMFFRDGPYKARTDICYKCHDVNAYQRRNAHDQRDDNGNIKEHTGLLCHDKLDGLDKAQSISDVGFNVKESLVRVCGSCHELKPHPSGNFTFTSKGTPNHLVVPPDKMKEKMRQSEQERGVILPLDPNTGRVFCGTCHNPHEKGVIKKEAAAKGADEKNRLRTQNICTNCHDK